MFDPVDPKQSFPDLERGILEYWRNEDIFQRSIRERSAEQTFSFYDGPPFATGLPHYGHLLAGTIKDVIPRYRTMRGMRVERRFGWDCHGLPIENLIEKEQGLAGKDDIEKLGIDRFNDLCRASVQRYVQEWRDTVERMGRWVDMNHDYKTMDPSYMESLWWVFAQLCTKNLIYEGHKPMHICPRCVTPLSNFEVTQGYKDITDQTAIVRFILSPSNENGEQTRYLLAWTTTPWTLPGNLFLAVNPALEYVEIEHKNNTYIVSKDRAAHLFDMEEIPSNSVRPIDAKSLIGLGYEPVFPYFTDRYPHAFRVVEGSFVTDTEGTGVVHIAPGFGDDDFLVGEREGVDVLQHVGLDGTFVPEVKDFAGLSVKPTDDPSKTDRAIIAYLDAHDLLFSTESYKHSYPHCWRCDSPLLNYATGSWFVAVEQLKDRLLAANAKTDWVPAHLRDGRFGNWLAHARDWAISRNRYWGTPLPVWRATEGDDRSIDVVESRADLMKHCAVRFTKITTLRHGEAQHNVQGFYQSSIPGVELTQTGESQARATGVLLQKEGDVDVIYCSPLRRTLQTAELIAEQTGARIIVDERLQEVDVGPYEGQPFGIHNADVLTEKRRKKHAESLPESLYHEEGMESSASVQRRIQEFLRERLPLHRSEHVVIVTHADPMLSIRQFFTQEDAYKISNAPFPQYAQPERFFWDHDHNASMDLHRDRIDSIAWPASASENDPTILLVRHGETDWNKEGKIQGGTQDIPLNDTGRAQAADLAEQLRDQPFDVVVCSPLHRCVETAQIICDTLQLTLDEPIDALAERNLGTWGGLKRADILKDLPPDPHESNPAFSPYTPPEGESLSAFLQRIQQAYDQIRQRYAGKRVLVVAHRGTIQALSAVCENLTHTEAVASALGNAETRTYTLAPLKRRIPEVLDCWFESGSMPYAQKEFPHHPLYGMDAQQVKVMPPGFPAQFVAENLDQTRGWFYTLMVLSTALYDVPAFEHCICGGIVLAEDGRKMSKRLKNYPDPTELMDAHGADALRFALMSSPVVRAETLRFSERTVEEAVQRIILPLWNSYSFFVTYANVADIRPTNAASTSPHPLDRWILAEIQDLTNRMTEQLDSYDLSATCQELHETIDALTNWYIRLSRRRFAGQADLSTAQDDATARDQSHALHTLYDVLLTFCRLLAPLCPLVTEAIYLNLTDEPHGSIHLTQWPEPRPLTEEEHTLLLRTRLLRQIVSLGHTVRGEAGMKQRQPLAEATVAFPPSMLPGGALTADEESLLRHELNVQTINVLQDPGELGMPIAYVDARKVGPRLGKRVQDVLQAGKRGDFSVQEDGQILIGEELLAPDEVEIRYTGKEGTNIASHRGIVLSIDTTLTPALLQDGLARDVIRSIQKLRKEAGFTVGQQIVLGLGGIDDLLDTHRALLEHETCSRITTVTQQTHSVSLGDDRTLLVQLPSPSAA